jgi:putative ABC transport system permease protein
MNYISKTSYLYIVNLFSTISLAYRSIKQNGIKTVITCCIIAVGIMSLVGILTAIDGLKTYLTKDFSAMGANTFKLRNASLGVRLDDDDEKQKIYRKINVREAKAFKQKFNPVRPVSIQVICSPMATMKFKNEKSNPNIRIVGSDENYLLTEGFSILEGRNFTKKEILSGPSVVILGNEVATKLYKEPERSVGNFTLIDGKRYLVIGVCVGKGTSMITNDNFAIIPFENGRLHFQIGDASYLLSVIANNAEELPQIISDAKGILRVVRGLSPREENDFDILKSDSISEMLVEKTQYVTLGGFIIGIITLFGAAIGLMNIMLVSVTERTREIGTMKAIGANNKSILTQFLMEAILICQIGGAFGILLGITIGNLVSKMIGGAFIIPWNWIIVGVLFCLFVGLVSGIYPAFKASRQDPIEALRYE